MEMLFMMLTFRCRYTIFHSIWAGYSGASCHCLWSRSRKVYPAIGKDVIILDNFITWLILKLLFAQSKGYWDRLGADSFVIVFSLSWVHEWLWLHMQIIQSFKFDDSIHKALSIGQWLFEWESLVRITSIIISWIPEYRSSVDWFQSGDQLIMQNINVIK